MTSEPEINPYECPMELNEARQSGNALDLVFFLINFTVSIAFIFLALMSIVVSFAGRGSPYELFGAIFCVGPAIAMAIGEWLLFIRKREQLKLPLGAVCGAVAAFMAFGFVVNAFEALTDKRSPDTPSDPPGILFWLIFGSISVAIISYCSFCFWHRIRDQFPPAKPHSGGIA